MSTSPDLAIQQLSPNQTLNMVLPATIASAATIAPTTRYTRITGTTPIVTITPPTTAYHELVLSFASAFATALNTGGNITTAITSVVDRPVTIYYDPRTALYQIATVV